MDEGGVGEGGGGGVKEKEEKRKGVPHFGEHVVLW